MKIIAKTSVTLILTLSLGVSAYPMTSAADQFAYIQKDKKDNKDKPVERDKKPPEKDKPKDDKGGKKGR